MVDGAIAPAIRFRARYWRVDLHPVWWLWFPPLPLLTLYGFYLYDHALYLRLFNGEQGLVELATPLIALVGVSCGLAALRDLRLLPNSGVRAWALLATVGLLYFAGEEVSWGQHIFGWSAPEPLKHLNDQGETNLHNVSSWFDQKPRLVLELWVLAGGIVVPLLHTCAERGESRKHWELDWRNWFWPTYVVLPSALLAIGIRLPERLKTLLQVEAMPLEIRYSEAQECYFALFLTLYLASLAYRLRRLKHRQGRAADSVTELPLAVFAGGREAF